MTREEFFSRVDEILGDRHPERTAKVGSRGRWWRGAGDGRYPGRGLIRYYSNDSIHVLLHTPALTRTFSSAGDALVEIERCLSDV